MSMNLDMYGDHAGRRVLYHVDGPDITRQKVATVQERFQKFKFENTKDVTKGPYKISIVYHHILKSIRIGIEILSFNSNLLIQFLDTSIYVDTTFCIKMVFSQ